MAENQLIPEVTRKLLYCPDCKIETDHVYEGKFRIYSRWRCLICGRVILGEPISPQLLPFPV